MKVPQESIELAKHFEGLFLKPYICPAGFWTIGYGHLCKPTQTVITPAQAEALLAEDLIDSLNHTIRLCPVLMDEPERRLAAIVDFTFNLGAGRLKNSTLRHKINIKDWGAACRELNKWVYGGGRVLPGLVKRRQAEALLLR